MTGWMTKTRIDTMKDEACAHCGEILHTITYDEVLTLSLDPHPSYADASLMWGCCEVCLNILYAADLSVIPNQGFGTFFNDFCWSAESGEVFTVQIPGYGATVYLASYQNVHDVMITEKEGSEVLKLPVSSLDIYRSLHWAADDLEAAIDRAKMMAEIILNTPMAKESPF